MDGIAKINATEAMAKAQNMKQLANLIKDLLDQVDLRMRDINDEQTGIYHGKNKPSELRRQLDEYKRNFSNFYDQIIAFANNITTTATRMLNE